MNCNERAEKRKKRDKRGLKTLLFVLLGGGVLLLGLCFSSAAFSSSWLSAATRRRNSRLPAPGDPATEMIGKWEFVGDYGNNTTSGKARNDRSSKRTVASTFFSNDRPSVATTMGIGSKLARRAQIITLEVTYVMVIIHPGTRDSGADAPGNLLLHHCQPQHTAKEIQPQDRWRPTLQADLRPKKLGNGTYDPNKALQM